MGTRSIGRFVPLHYHILNAVIQCLSIELLRCEIQAKAALWVEWVCARQVLIAVLNAAKSA